MAEITERFNARPIYSIYIPPLFRSLYAINSSSFRININILIYIRKRQAEISTGRQAGRYVNTAREGDMAGSTQSRILTDTKHDRQAAKQPGRQAGRQASRQASRQETGRQTNRQSDSLAETQPQWQKVNRGSTETLLYIRSRAGHTRQRMRQRVKDVTAINIYVTRWCEI